MRPTVEGELSVRRTLSRLARALDERDAAAVADVFADDGRYVAAGVAYAGRDGFAALCARHGDAIVTHASAHPVVEVDGDGATVRSFAMRMHTHLADMPVRRTPVITWLGYTTDELRRHGDGWKLVSRVELPWADDVLSMFATDDSGAR